MIAMRVLLPIVMFASVASAQLCPNCDSPSSFVPFPGHGTGSNGGRIITICFDKSAQADNNFNPTPGTTNTALWNGLNGARGAIQNWNSATYDGAHSGYSLEYHCSGTPDIYTYYMDHTAVNGDCSSAPPCSELQYSSVGECEHRHVAVACAVLQRVGYRDGALSRNRTYLRTERLIE
jgi:hypothetical protein